MKKYCVKCGHEFEAAGREVICPACKQAAAAESKRAAVLRAKAASWRGESVPVRISGRASTVIRRYGAEKGLSFAAALDELLKGSDFFKATGKAWEDVTPYKSRRRDKASTAQGKPQDKPQDKPQRVVKVRSGEVTSAEARAARASARAVSSRARVSKKEISKKEISKKEKGE